MTAGFETVTVADRASDGRVNVEVAVISVTLPEEPASVYLSLDGVDQGAELIADLTPEMARKLSNALNAAAAEAAHLNIEAAK